MLIWIGLILRFIDLLLIGLEQNQVGRVLNIYISFFTIESNILLAIFFTILTIKTFQNKPFSYPALRGAITLYITITGLIYALFLAKIHHVEGISLISTYILHYITPPVAIIDWFLFEERHIYKYRYSFTWLIYPLTYFIYIMIRGFFINIYPYPFINLNNIGFYQVIINVFLLFLTFWFIGLIIITINKKLKLN